VSAVHTRLLHYLCISHVSPDNGLLGMKYVLNDVMKAFQNHWTVIEVNSF
jgi:hypothetical protein